MSGANAMRYLSVADAVCLEHKCCVDFVVEGTHAGKNAVMVS